MREGFRERKRGPVYENFLHTLVLFFVVVRLAALDVDAASDRRRRKKDSDFMRRNLQFILSVIR